MHVSSSWSKAQSGGVPLTTSWSSPFPSALPHKTGLLALAHRSFINATDSLEMAGEDLGQGCVKAFAARALTADAASLAIALSCGISIGS